MRSVRFGSLHITHKPQQPVTFEVANDYSPEVTINGDAVGKAECFREGLFSLNPRPSKPMFLVTALATFVVGASAMLPQADVLKSMLCRATTDLLSPTDKAVGPKVTLDRDTGNASVILG